MRAIAHHQIFKKQYWRKHIHFTPDDHATSKSSANVPFSGANGFRRLDGEYGDVSAAERGQYSVQASSRGGVTPDQGIELAQVTRNGQIRVTNAVQVDIETSKARTHRQETANN